MTGAISKISNRVDLESAGAVTLEQDSLKKLAIIDTVLQQINQVNTSALKSSGFVQKFTATGDDALIQSMNVADGSLDGILAGIQQAPLDPNIGKSAAQVGKSIKIALGDAALLPDLYAKAHKPDSTEADKKAFDDAADALITRFDGVGTRAEGMRLSTANARRDALAGMIEASKKRASAKDIAVLGQTAADARSDLVIATRNFWPRTAAAGPIRSGPRSSRWPMLPRRRTHLARRPD